MISCTILLLLSVQAIAQSDLWWCQVYPQWCQGAATTTTTTTTTTAAPTTTRGQLSWCEMYPWWCQTTVASTVPSWCQRYPWLCQTTTETPTTTTAPSSTCEGCICGYLLEHWRYRTWNMQACGSGYPPAVQGASLPCPGCACRQCKCNLVKQQFGQEQCPRIGRRKRQSTWGNNICTLMPWIQGCTQTTTTLPPPSDCRNCDCDFLLGEWRSRCGQSTPPQGYMSTNQCQGCSCQECICRFIRNTYNSVCLRLTTEPLPVTAPFSATPTVIDNNSTSPTTVSTTQPSTTAPTTKPTRESMSTVTSTETAATELTTETKTTTAITLPTTETKTTTATTIPTTETTTTVPTTVTAPISVSVTPPTTPPPTTPPPTTPPPTTPPPTTPPPTTPPPTTPPPTTPPPTTPPPTTPPPTTPPPTTPPPTTPPPTTPPPTTPPPTTPPPTTPPPTTPPPTTPPPTTPPPTTTAPPCPCRSPFTFTDHACNTQAECGGPCSYYVGMPFASTGAAGMCQSFGGHLVKFTTAACWSALETYLAGQLGAQDVTMFTCGKVTSFNDPTLVINWWCPGVCGGTASTVSIDDFARATPFVPPTAGDCIAVRYTQNNIHLQFVDCASNHHFICQDTCP
ncbi:mucin-2 [Lingula anatina]|uniref:Mucin-2 n=1 Tax=Lingula anatina TaxID=7574 RepID=A0A1S3HU27_LINAN|nr:mucin-2 [Lingula anatina]|eukprot:XP_013389550.1 mucin-2 [Lingula anatina]